MKPTMKKGFGTVELLVVIAIVGFLASIVWFSLPKAVSTPTPVFDSPEFWAQEKAKVDEARARKIQKAEYWNKMEKFCGKGNVSAEYPLRPGPLLSFKCTDYSLVPLSK